METNEMGFCKLPRQIKETGWYTDKAMFSVYTHLLLEADWRRQTVNGTEVFPNSVVCTLTDLCRITEMPRGQLRCALERLENEGVICRKKIKGLSVITLLDSEDWDSRNKELQKALEKGCKQYGIQ